MYEAVALEVPYHMWAGRESGAALPPEMTFRREQPDIPAHPITFLPKSNHTTEGE